MEIGLRSTSSVVRCELFSPKRRNQVSEQNYMEFVWRHLMSNVVTCYNNMNSQLIVLMKRNTKLYGNDEE